MAKRSPISATAELLFKKAAVRHLGFVVCTVGPLAKSISWAFITVQNLVVIDAVVSIICKF